MNLSHISNPLYRQTLRLIILLLLCSGVASAQFFRETIDTATFDLNGSVRKVEHSIALFEGEVTTPLPYLETMTFNKKGFIKESSRLDTESDMVTERVVYDHSGSGKLRMVETYENEQLVRRDESRYKGQNWRATFYTNADGQLEAVATVKNYRQEVPADVPHMEYTFDEAMRPKVERTYFPGEAEPMRTVRSTYEDGQLVKVAERGPDGALVSRQNYRYDKKGRVKAMRMYDTTDSERTRTTYDYDNHDNVVAESNYDADGAPISLLMNIYTYDEEGNWLTKATFYRESEDASFEQQSLETRTIKYHQE